MRQLLLYIDDNISFNKGSSFQGFIMQNIDTNYATILHNESIRPYSQYLERKKENTIWHIGTYDEIANKKIIDALQNITNIKIENADIEYVISKKEVIEEKEKELFLKCNNNDNSRFIKLFFVTPTAFKHNEEYYYFPDIRMIFQSILSKYNLYNDNMYLSEEDFLLPLVDTSYICDYKIRTSYYYIEQTRIKGFMGSVTIRLDGPKPLVALTYMLAKYGIYTGVGIKTAMGMGGMKMVNFKTNFQ